MGLETLSKGAARMPATASAWFACLCFLHLSKRSRRELGSIWVGRDLEASRWTLQKTNGEARCRGVAS